MDNSARPHCRLKRAPIWTSGNTNTTSLRLEIFCVGRRLQPDTHAWRMRVTPLFTRHAEDRFNLALIGGFSRGKSSLVNAILGVDRLPTGIVPLTSVITSVSCGTVDRAVLRYKSSILDQDISLTDLREYITQTGNPGNSNGIREAEIQLPAEFLRRGFHFVDTPGLGSAIRENTLSVCPETS